jgi:hypothetical protein
MRTFLREGRINVLYYAVSEIGKLGHIREVILAITHITLKLHVKYQTRNS